MKCFKLIIVLFLLTGCNLQKVNPNSNVVNQDNTSSDLSMDWLYQKNDYEFYKNMSQSDVVHTIQDGQYLYLMGIHQELLQFDGNKVNAVFDEVKITEFSVKDDVIYVLPWPYEQSYYVVDGITGNFIKKDFYLPTASQNGCQAPFLYNLTENESFYGNYRPDETDFNACGSGYLNDNEFNRIISGNLLGYIEIEDHLIYIKGAGRSGGQLYIDDVFIEDGVIEAQGNSDYLYYLKLDRRHSEYNIQEYYLKKIDLHSLEMSDVIEYPVMSFLVDGKDLYYSLDPTIITQDISLYLKQNMDYDKCRLSSNKGVFHIDALGNSTLIYDGVTASFGMTQYGLVAISEQEDTIKLILFTDEGIVELQTDLTINAIQGRWSTNDI